LPVYNFWDERTIDVGYAGGYVVAGAGMRERILAAKSPDQIKVVELRRINPGVRVVMTSGFSSSEDIQEMQRLGLTAQLPKPYRRAELSKAISNAIHDGKK